MGRLIQSKIAAEGSRYQRPRLRDCIFKAVDVACQQCIVRLAGGYRINHEACVIRACHHEMLAVAEF